MKKASRYDMVDLVTTFFGHLLKTFWCTPH